ncbi:MAG: ABC transporter ATP-binding protein [Fimbriimonadales bacterium]
MIRAEGASLVYQDPTGPVHACRDISLEIGPGEFVGILGPSGSGKSSLLYLLSGLKTPTSGRVTYRDVDFRSMPVRERDRLRRTEFGMLFQYPYLLGYLTALENVLVANGGAAASDRAAELLGALGLGSKMHRRPRSLSGGEKQRVCVARALLNRPHVIFADEPTASLDHATGLAVVRTLREQRGQGSIVLVTHDPAVLEGANRVVRLEDGRIVEVEERIHAGV